MADISIYNFFAEAGASITVRFEMKDSNGALQTGKTVTGNYLGVGDSSYANITTLTNTTVSEVGSGTYEYTLTAAEVGSSDGIAKLLFTEASCMAAVVTLEVTTEVPANVTTMSDKSGYALSSAGWREFLEMEFDGVPLWEILVDLADFMLAPADNANSLTPGIKSMNGVKTRWYFESADADGNRSAAAIRDTSDNPAPWGAS